MARGRKQKKKIAPPLDLLGPTDDRVSKGQEIERAGRAIRFTPVIDTMHKRGDLTDDEYSRLGYYRDQALLAEKSPRSALDPTPRGEGGQPSATILTAICETGRIERDLGVLRLIARAVAVEDLSLSEWCVAQFGGRERYDGKGKFIAIVPSAEKRVMALAKMELRMAAHRIMR